MVLAALLAGSFVALSPTAMARACGVERWREKTLTDTRAGRIKLTPRTSTVDALRRKKVVRDPQGLRASGVETAVYRVRAQLIGFKREDDGDIHLVISSLESRSRTMIVEFPDSTCTKGARQSLRRRMSRAKSRLQHACGVPSASFARLQGTATFSGVGFFDFIHGQTGVAPNGIELHPVLSVGGDDLATCARAV